MTHLSLSQSFLVLMSKLAVSLEIASLSGHIAYCSNVWSMDVWTYAQQFQARMASSAALALPRGESLLVQISRVRRRVPRPLVTSVADSEAAAPPTLPPSLVLP